MKNAALSGKPYAGNPHVRFDEGEVASAKPRRGSLLYKLAYAVLFGVFLSTVAEGAERTWTGADVANDPSWANGKNWQGEAAPGAGDEAYFPAVLGDCEVVVSDADAALVSSLANVRGDSASRGPKIVFNVTTNLAIGCKIAACTVVKRQNASVELMSGGLRDYYYMDAIVEEGTLILPRTASVNGYWAMNGLVVSNGASVYLPDAVTMKATLSLQTLLCAGLLTNANASVQQGLRINGTTEEQPARFTETGRLGGLVYVEAASPLVVETDQLTFEGEARVWTANGKTLPASWTVRKIGMRDAVASSIGGASASKAWRFRYNGGIWRYAGEGETTDRQLYYSLDWYDYSPYHVPTLDAGAVGGVTFAGKWHGGRSYNHDTLKADVFEIALTGSNAVPCVLANEIAPVESDGVDRPLYLVKQGTGTWRFNDHAARRNNGVIAVEEGTLQFETIAAKGFVCSLGTADALQERYFGVYDAARSVNYAYLLGTETTEGTMEHVGAGNATCMDRPFRLAGDGRLTASGGTLALGDVSALTAGEKTLTLDGTNAVKNMIYGVTNGAGTVSLVKDGPGTWRLAGECDISGDLAVKAGTLEVAGAGESTPYSYFRFTSYETLGAESQANYCYQHSFDELSLFSADGARRNLDMVWDAEPHDKEGFYAIDVDILSLQPGHANYAFSAEWYYYASNDYGMDKLWDQTCGGYPFLAWQKAGGINATAARYSVPSRRVSIVMRLPKGTPEITRYDFCAGGMNIGSATNQLPKVFELEGSVDGLRWQRLHFKQDQTALSNKARWCSDDTPFNTQYTNRGFRVTGHPDFGVQLSSVRSVSVAAGATLRADGTAAPIRGLRVSASGAGTIDGFTFAAPTEERPCTLDVVDVPPGAKVVLPGTYANCQGLANVTEWNLRIGGVPSKRYEICHENGKLALVKRGLIFLVR